MNDWPVRTLIRGDWKLLSQADAQDILGRLCVLEHGAGLSLSASIVEYQRIRVTPLACLGEWWLLEAEARFSDGALGYRPLLMGRGVGILLPNGKTESILHAYHLAGRPNLTGQAEAQYIELFVALLYGPAGRFNLAWSLDDLILAPGYDHLDESALAPLLPPDFQRQSDTPCLKCVMTYCRGLYQVALRLNPDGVVTMETTAQLANLPLRREHLTQSFRIPTKDPYSESDTPEE